MRLFLSIFVALSLLSLPVRAGEPQVVVELYTSQGCSSCPPADAFLHDLAARDDVIALAMHVDYWDYIGWKDIFANPAYSDRQRGYARAGGRRMVYTPQMIINGTDHVVGNRPQDVEDLLAKHARVDQSVALSAARDGNTVSITVTPGRAVKGPVVVQLIRYKPQQNVAIKRGENAGRSLSYANIVTEINVLREWNGRDPLTVEAGMNGDLPGIILMQGKGQGPVVAAVRVQ